MPLTRDAHKIQILQMKPIRSEIRFRSKPVLTKPDRIKSVTKFKPVWLFGHKIRLTPGSQTGFYKNRFLNRRKIWQKLTKSGSNRFQIGFGLLTKFGSDWTGSDQIGSWVCALLPLTRWYLKKHVKWAVNYRNSWWVHKLKIILVSWITIKVLI